MKKPDQIDNNRRNQGETGDVCSDDKNNNLKSLMSQLDELGRLCGESPGRGKFSGRAEIPGKDSDVQYAHQLELGELILECLDGNISGPEFSILEKWIRENPEAMQYYLDYVCLCACLQLPKHTEMLLQTSNPIKAGR